MSPNAVGLPIEATVAHDFANAVTHGRTAAVQDVLSGGEVDVNEPIGSSGATPLHIACENGHTETASVLLVAGADANAVKDNSATPLHIACRNGHTATASVLLAAGADANTAADDGATPLLLACQDGHTETAAMVLGAGADVDKVSFSGGTPLHIACQQGHLACVQLASSYGAARVVTMSNGSTTFSAEDVAADFANDAIVAWLTTSRPYFTPLHHVATISAERTRALLRAGANLHAAAAVDWPTPLSLARELRDAGEGTAAQLVLAAGEPWSRHTHALFPAAARARAVALWRLGQLLALEPRFAGVAGAITHIWEHGVMHFVVDRDAINP